MAHTTTPMASSAVSRRGNCAISSGATPSPVLYPGHRSLRKDSTTWSVATPTWVAPSLSMVSIDDSTPRTAPISPPSELGRGGEPKKWRKSS